MMKKKHMILLVILLICVLCCALFFILRQLTSGSPKKAERLFSAHSEEFQVISDYLLGMDCDSILIEDDEMLYLLSPSETDASVIQKEIKSIADEEVAAAVQSVYEAGCNHITKDGETVKFLFWTRFTDFGAGIVCHRNKTSSPEVQFLTRLVPLTVSGWYYYEADYNEWRLSQSFLS